MKHLSWKKILPHLLVFLVFLVVAVLYCSPVLKGEVVNQHDIAGWKGMAQQSFVFKEKYGHFPLWTNSMFSGMPGYQIAMDPEHQFSIGYLYHVLTLGLPKPISFFFLACVSFYILMLVMRIRPWIGCMAAIAYAYSTFDPIIVAVGHDTQMQALGLAPGVIAAMFLLFRKSYWGGAMMMAVFFGLLVSTGHIQVVYYTLLIVAAMSIAFAIQCLRKKEWKHLVTSFAIALVTALVGLGSTAVTTLTTYDYVPYSMRGGGSELKNTGGDNATPGGLNKDYAFNYSYGIAETFSLMLPSIYGGGDGGTEFSSSKFADELTKVGYPEETALDVANGYSYWGMQPGTSGPVYLGAIICFLFILAFFVSDSPHKWWILAVSVFGILLAWGKNFESFNYFLYDHMPLYKKFRAVTMGLVIPQLCFPLLAAIGLQDFFTKSEEGKLDGKKLRLAGLVTLGLFLLLLVFYAGADFKGPRDANLQTQFEQGFLQQLARNGSPSPQAQQQAAEMASGFVKALRSDRQSLFMKDLARNLVLVALVFGTLWFYSKKKFGYPVAIGIILLLSSFDILAVGKRYLGRDKFVDESEFESVFTPTAADQAILQDTGYYRVFDQSGFETSRTSYYHNSIGGYHPAKLSIYQDLIDSQISKFSMPVFNMLNTKYFILNNPQNGQPVAQMNAEAFGPAWMTGSILYVPDARAEMGALDSTDLRHVAIVEQSLQPEIKTAPTPDSTATINLVENRNDYIHYQSHAAQTQFAVFSEIYYPAGWTATIDGSPATIIRTDYALRGLLVPPGDHNIEFRFAPHSYQLGNTITLWSSVLTYLLLAAGAWVYWRQRKNTTSDAGNS